MAYWSGLMNETEHRKGTLTYIPVPKDLTWIEQVNYLIYKGWAFHEIDEDEKYCDAQLKHLNGMWWDITEKEIDPYDEIVKARKLTETHYEYECRWHNGEASFDEVLEQALKGAD